MKKLLSAFFLSIIIFNSSFASIEEKTLLLAEGTLVKAIVKNSVSSANAVVGQPIEAEVSEDVVIDNKIVIKKGTNVKGSISAIQRAQRMGRGGNISLQVNSVKAIDNQKVTLRSALGRVGQDKTGSTVALTVLISPLFLLKKGHEAGIRKGTEIKAYVDEDISIVSSTPAEETVLENSK